MLVRLELPNDQLNYVLMRSASCCILAHFRAELGKRLMCVKVGSPVQVDLCLLQTDEGSGDVHCDNLCTGFISEADGKMSCNAM